MTYWTLTDKNTLLARTVARSVVGDIPNKRVAPDVDIDPGSPDEQAAPQGRKGSSTVVGDDDYDLKLDLLSNMKMGTSFNLDPTDVIGYSFVWTDAKKVPTKATVVEVDE